MYRCISNLRPFLPAVPFPPHRLQDESQAKSTNHFPVLGGTSAIALTNPIALQERCVNPVCTPGTACPDYRCAPTTVLPTTTARCLNPVCKPGEFCPLYRCATPTPTTFATSTRAGCVNPTCKPGQACPEYRCAGA